MTNRDIVVIGGSAGSIQPLRALLARLPHDIPASVIVVIHIPAESAGILTAIAMDCSLKVVMAEDGMRLKYATVYMARPDHHLLVFNDRLRLGQGPRENLVRPAIDPLFRSAALTVGPRAIGVILSGMLNDGAAGLAAIKQCGGIAMVQAPNTAEYADMPIAALEATPVDLSAVDLELARAIISHVDNEPGPAGTVPAGLQLEVDIAAGSPSSSPLLEEIGCPVALTCPDCGGVLSEIGGSKPIRFRCQVGHAYTGKVLLSQQEGQVDEAMRVALRIVEERAELISRMGRNAAAVGRSGMAETYARREKEYRLHAGTLRDALLRVNKAANFSDETDVTQHEVQSDFESSS